MNNATRTVVRHASISRLALSNGCGELATASKAFRFRAMSTTTSSSSSSRSRSTNHNYTVKNFRGRSLGCYGFSPFSNKNTRSFSTTSTPSGETETTKDDNAVESESSLSNDNNKGATTTTTTNNNAYDPYEITKSFEDTSYYYPPSEETEPKFLAAKYQGMTNEELVDTSTIRVNVNDNDKELLVQWDDALMHSPPVRDKNASLPKGCLVGRVVSTKMQKTVNVAVDRYNVHPKYRKRIRYTRKFMAHDENGQIKTKPC